MPVIHSTSAVPQTVTAAIAIALAPMCRWAGTSHGQACSRVRSKLIMTLFSFLIFVIARCDLAFVNGTIRLPRRGSTVSRNYRIVTNKELLNDVDIEGMILLDVSMEEEIKHLGRPVFKTDCDYVNVPIDGKAWPFEEDKWMEAIRKSHVNPRTGVLVVSSEGIFSKVAAKTLESHGFRLVLELNEGVSGWKDSGNPVVPVEGAEDEFEAPIEGHEDEY